MLTIQQKRRLTYVTIGVFFVLGGIEYAVILPTLWLYLSEKFGASSYFLGLVLSAFSLADMLASPIIGRWSDRTGNTRVIVLIANLPQFIGSIMYFLGISPWFLVASRFVVGLGCGASAALLADIARVTTEEERTSKYAIFMSCRQIGLLLGPGCNLFLMHIKFSIGPFVVNSYSIPGLFMAFLWIIHELLTIFMFWNLTGLRLQERVEESLIIHDNSPDHQTLVTDPPPPSGPELMRSVDPDLEYSQLILTHSDSQRPAYLTQSLIQSTPSNDGELTSSNDYMDIAEQFICGSVTRRPLSAPSEDSDMHSQPSLASRPLSADPINCVHSRHKSKRRGCDYGSTDVDRRNVEASADNTVQQIIENGVISNSDVLEKICEDRTVVINADVTWRYYWSEFVREEIIAILATVFVAFFNQLAFETMLTPLTNKYLKWQEFQNSLLYFGAGVEVIIVFMVILPLSRRVKDRTMLLVGFILETCTIAFFLWFVPQAKEGDYGRNLPPMIIGIFVDLIGLPILVVTSASLYSKLTRRETQGFAQGIRRAFGQVGMILGPLWAGSMIYNPYWMFGVMLFVNLLPMCLLLLSFRRLSPAVSNDVDIIDTDAAQVNNAERQETEPLLH